MRDDGATTTSASKNTVKMLDRIGSSARFGAVQGERARINQTNGAWIGVRARDGRNTLKPKKMTSTSTALR